MKHEKTDTELLAEKLTAELIEKIDKMGIKNVYEKLDPMIQRELKMNTFRQSIKRIQRASKNETLGKQNKNVSDSNNGLFARVTKQQVFVNDLLRILGIDARSFYSINKGTDEEDTLLKQIAERVNEIYGQLEYMNEEKQRISGQEKLKRILSFISFSKGVFIDSNDVKNIIVNDECDNNVFSRVDVCFMTLFYFFTEKLKETSMTKRYFYFDIIKEKTPKDPKQKVLFYTVFLLFLCTTEISIYPENKKKKTTIQDTFETNIENISLTLKNLLENQNLFRLFSEPSDRKEVFCKIQEIFEELSRTFYISEESRNKFFTQEILHPWKKASIHIDFEISDKMNSVLDECEKYFEEKIEEKDI